MPPGSSTHPDRFAKYAIRQPSTLPGTYIDKKNQQHIKHVQLNLRLWSGVHSPFGSLHVAGDLAHHHSTRRVVCHHVCFFVVRESVVNDLALL